MMINLHLAMMAATMKIPENPIRKKQRKKKKTVARWLLMQHAHPQTLLILQTWNCVTKQEYGQKR